MSSETLSPSTKKTKSAHSRKYLFFASGAVALGIAFLCVWLFANNSSKIVSIDDFSIEVVDAPDTRTLGLSGRTSFDKNQAMIFDFNDGSNGRCFWMKDMNFSIDIIWLDNNKRVQKIVANASPKSYPKESFCADKNPRYVIELTAGRAHELNIKQGAQVEF